MSDRARRMAEPAAAAPLATLEPDLGLNPGAVQTIESAGAESAPEAADWGGLSDAFLTIWTEPRETIRRIVSLDPRYGVLLLAGLGGSTTILTPWPQGGPLSPGVPAKLVLACTLGPLGYIAALWLYAWAVRKVGRLFDGEATPEEMRAALAWANAPNAVILPLVLVLALLLAPALHLQGSTLLSAVTDIVALVAAVGGVWGIVIGSNTVAEVQGYRSAWKGFANVAVALAALIAVALFVIGVVLAGGTRL